MGFQTVTRNRSLRIDFSSWTQGSVIRIIYAPLLISSFSNLGITITILTQESPLSEPNNWIPSVFNQGLLGNNQNRVPWLMALHWNWSHWKGIRSRNTVWFPLSSMRGPLLKNQEHEQWSTSFTNTGVTGQWSGTENTVWFPHSLTRHHESQAGTLADIPFLLCRFTG